MFQRLSGREEGLVSLWNFADGTPRDASPNGYHGKLIGNARVVPAQLPASEQLLRLTVLSGTARDPAGKAVPSATIRIWDHEKVLTTARSAPDGSYLGVLRTESKSSIFTATTRSRLTCRAR